jgi:hypothetical protein
LLLALGSAPALGVRAQVTDPDSTAPRLVYVAPARSLPVVGSVASEASLSLGEGDEASSQFVEVMDALRLSDGRLVVAEFPSQELRFYSPADVSGFGAPVDFNGRVIRASRASDWEFVALGGIQ